MFESWSRFAVNGLGKMIAMLNMCPAINLKQMSVNLFWVTSVEREHKPHLTHNKYYSEWNSKLKMHSD
jgi:hypothetical protein